MLKCFCMKIKDLKDKNILILGFGLEGKDTFSFLRKHFPKKEISIADAKNIKDIKLKNVKWILGRDYLSSLNDYDVIIKTPGIPLKKIKTKVLITSQTQLFLENCNGTVIGVTGTKGKSTTSSLICHVLKKNKFNAYLIGNIETPALSYLDKKGIFVYEMSCHQLDGLTVSPHIAVFINIYPEHLDYYSSFKSYFNAKANIALHQKKSDYFVYNPKFKLIDNLKVKSKRIPINNYESVFKDNPWLLEITHKDNIIAVLKVCEEFVDIKSILNALKSFKCLPHRLEYIGQYKGIHFYDDSISTIPESTIYALDKLGDNVETLIVGGLDRGIDFKKLGKRIDKSKISNLVVFPDSGEKILKIVKRKINHYSTSSMKEAVRFCFKNTSKDKICLLSPASSSYNLFKNFKERGDLFKKYIHEE
jgi:UDP-N-acetylmuramoyl-L-alanine---L-glutamate ligase